MVYASRGQGVHGSGSRNYSPEQANRVLLILTSECVGPQNRMTVELLTARVGLNNNGRALRDIVSDLEKAKRVLTDFSDGYYVCTTAEQAERATHRLDSQISNMKIRADARREMTAELDDLQPRLAV